MLFTNTINNMFLFFCLTIYLVYNKFATLELVNHTIFLTKVNNSNLTKHNQYVTYI